MIELFKRWFEQGKAVLAYLTVKPAVGMAKGRMFVQADGTTDLSRVLGALIVLVFLGLTTYSVVALSHPLDMANIGDAIWKVCLGVALLILGHNYAKN